MEDVLKKIIDALEERVKLDEQKSINFAHATLAASLDAELNPPEIVAALAHALNHVIAAAPNESKPAVIAFFFSQLKGAEVAVRQITLPDGVELDDILPGKSVN